MMPSVLVSLALLGLSSSDLETPSAIEASHRALCDHYDRVLEELSGSTPEGFDAEQCAARARTIELLTAYRARADFGVDAESEGERAPLFVDGEGRRCAVAALLDGWGEGPLTLRVADEQNRAWIAEFEGDAVFAAWLARAGLTFEEAARIQGPAIMALPVANIGPSAGVPFAGGGAATPLAGPQGPSTGAAFAPITGVLSDPSTGVGGADPADWRVWWEWNKLAWMAPRRTAQALPAHDGYTVPETAIERARRELGERVAADLDHPVASVRAAAAVAHGRIAGAEAVPALCELLEDSHPEVRSAALLALGATGSDAAVHELLYVAHTGSTREAGARSQRVVPRARALAQVSLGLARASGAGEQAVAFLASPADAGATEARELSLARLYALELASSDELAFEARRTAEISKADGGRRSPRAKSANPTTLRASGVEALGHDGEDTMLPRLIDALGAREVELRRSAACALGELDDERALPPLLTAYELEHDVLARGLILVAIGRRGGEGARGFLEHQVLRGKRSQRHWAALGLGLLARADDDDRARATLRRAYRKENNRYRGGAWLVAMGIARDGEALELLTEELEDAGDADTRMYAALGLGLVGDPAAAKSLRRSLAVEASPLTRSSMGQALGLLGQPEDAVLLADELERASDPTIQVQFAAALGFHGSPEAIAALDEHLAGRGLGQSARAGVLQAVGLLLSRTEPFQLNRLSQHANPSVLPEWLLAPLLTTL